ncbi:hypothetical protein ASZ78_016486 [Callipepla squamata]|uniref:EGF-like domain-containing protein n=1 Tax=Callipepla squamata TaxID=9009 RepID=A0A226MQQ2_CALSU|nr:hypothetical protein ASZ78_016486 [Callipepla squamata]
MGLVYDQAPEITELENAGLCDIRQYDCTSVRAFGHGFRESSNLKCEIIRLQYSDSQWIPGEPLIMSAAFQNVGTVDCELPNNGPQSDVMDLVDDKPIAWWKIKVRVNSCDCLNNGSCVTNINFPPGSGRYLCACVAGFEGDLCQVNTDDCRLNQCGTGKCVDGINSYYCECPPELQETFEDISVGRKDSSGEVGENKGFEQSSFDKVLSSVPSSTDVPKRFISTEMANTSTLPVSRSRTVTAEKSDNSQRSASVQPDVTENIAHALGSTSGHLTDTEWASPENTVMSASSRSHAVSAEKKTRAQAEAYSHWETSKKASLSSRTDTSKGLSLPHNVFKGGNAHRVQHLLAKHRINPLPFALVEVTVPPEMLPEDSDETLLPKAVTCADLPCFPGVPCEQSQDDRVKCGRCPYELNSVFTAHCKPPCKNGGTCLARNLCTCPYGFVGPRCDTRLLCVLAEVLFLSADETLPMMFKMLCNEYLLKEVVICITEETTDLGKELLPAFVSTLPKISKE